jgi:hypothetical protein
MSELYKLFPFVISGIALNDRGYLRQDSTGHAQKNGAVSNVIKNLFIIQQGHIHCQQRELSKFFIRYQQLASHAYCEAAVPVSKMGSQKEKSFSMLRFEVSRYVITMQREFRARFKKCTTQE